MQMQGRKSCGIGRRIRKDSGAMRIPRAEMARKGAKMGVFLAILILFVVIVAVIVAVSTISSVSGVIAEEEDEE